MLQKHAPVRSLVLCRNILAALSLKCDRMLADQHYISILKHHLADAAIVDIRAVKTFRIFENIVVALPVDLGVMSGYGGIINLGGGIWLGAHRDPPDRKRGLSYPAV